MQRRALFWRIDSVQVSKFSPGRTPIDQFIKLRRNMFAQATGPQGKTIDA